ncbi:hypothetical protein DYB37_009722 [Aphanomyces astaci]|uniref:Uncharacterized protein n=1 Tax=Aphanomyces astaci TaxID=112090 RepID=A0A3R7A0F9_APHAT|nr:hypothetical protein DYB35_008261 [Aphanomyces astaci]RHZ13541.1 hypothetical protein DYB37_009722 [Aphanomyces astaci]
MYQFGATGTAYYWANMCVKAFNWEGFESSRLYNTIRWGSTFGQQDSPAESCLSKLKEYNVDTTCMEAKDDKFKKTFRAAARLKYLNLVDDLEGKLADPFNKKDSLSFDTLKTCVEVLCAYHQFFSHVCKWESSNVTGGFDFCSKSTCSWRAVSIMKKIWIRGSCASVLAVST